MTPETSDFIVVFLILSVVSGPCSRRESLVSEAMAKHELVMNMVWSDGDVYFDKA